MVVVFSVVTAWVFFFSSIFSFHTLFLSFLDASSYLYKSVCPSVRMSVGIMENPPKMAIWVAGRISLPTQAGFSSCSFISFYSSFSLFPFFQSAKNPLALRPKKPQCDSCGDDLRRGCRDCGCSVCGGKNEPQNQILCDECHGSFHIKCLPTSHRPKVRTNKAGYTAQYAPGTRLKITGDGRTDGPTDGQTDGRTDTTSYRDATAHQKSSWKINRTHSNQRQKKNLFLVFRCADASL